jgi:hypothetical protein
MGRTFSLLALFVFVILLVGLTPSGYASDASARTSRSAAKSCGTIFARNYFNGKDVRVSVARHADCRTAISVLRYYYNSGAPCAGSGCVLTTPSGWNCDTNPGEVQQKTGVITICVKGAGEVESHILRASATAASTCSGVHVGRAVGDGEYSDGAMLNAKGIRCRAALALVKPRDGAMLNAKGIRCRAALALVKPRDGAMLNAKGIRCRAALALVKPRYHAILEGKGPLALGCFRCTRSFAGPNEDDGASRCIDVDIHLEHSPPNSQRVGPLSPALSYSPGQKRCA